VDEIWRRNATRLGEELAQDHFSSLPVDPLQIADKLGIEVEGLPPEKKTVSGTLIRALFHTGPPRKTLGIRYS